MKNTAGNLHWNRHAPLWTRVASPLSPADEDCALFRKAIARK
jgi:hypothetical protein